MKNKNKITIYLKVLAASIAVIFIFPVYVFSAPSWSIELIDLTNTSRIAAGISTLSPNDILTAAAYSKAKDMIDKDYFAHISHEGITPWYWIKKEGYNYIYAGEKIAIEFDNYRDIHSAWIASPTHKDNILSQNYTDIGIATLEGEIDGEKTIVVVQMFGKTKEIQKVGSIAGKNVRQDQFILVINLKNSTQFLLMKIAK